MLWLLEDGFLVMGEVEEVDTISFEGSIGSSSTVVCAIASAVILSLVSIVVDIVPLLRFEVQLSISR